MPGWRVHLEAAKRANEKLKFDGIKKEQFFLGNILPDINNGWLVKGVHRILVHNDTHIRDNNEEACAFFCRKYAEELKKKNPIVLGYLLHLLLDATLNDDFYLWIRGTWIDKLPKDEKRILKQKEFAIFGNKYEGNKLKIEHLDEDVEAAAIIDEIDLTKEDLRMTENYLLMDWPAIEEKYQFYTEKKLEELVDTAVNRFLDMV